MLFISRASSSSLWRNGGKASLLEFDVTLLSSLSVVMAQKFNIVNFSFMRGGQCMSRQSSLLLKFYCGACTSDGELGLGRECFFATFESGFNNI